MHPVVLPCIHNSVLCPVTSVSEMFKRIPALPSQVAFGYWEAGRNVPLVEYKVRQILAQCTRCLCLDPHCLHSMLFAIVELLIAFIRMCLLRTLEYTVVGKVILSTNTCKAPQLLNRLFVV